MFGSFNDCRRSLPSTLLRLSSLARANADVWLAFGAPFRKEIGRDPLTPDEIGNTLAFLCSDAASGMNGATLIIDHGHVNATVAGAYEDPAIDGLLGRNT